MTEFHVTYGNESWVHSSEPFVVSKRRYRRLRGREKQSDRIYGGWPLITRVYQRECTLGNMAHHDLYAAHHPIYSRRNKRSWHHTPALFHPWKDHPPL